MNFDALLDYCLKHNIGLSIENQQLKIQCEDEQYTRELIAALQAHKSRLMAFLSESQAPVQTYDAELGAPTTFIQQRFWLLEQLYELAPAYHLSKSYRLNGAIEAGHILAAMAHVVEKHPSLRTTYAMVDGQLRQFIRTGNLEVDVHDMQGRSAREIRDYCNREIDKPFDLEQDLMIRFSLLTLAPDQYQLLLVVHHIACDGSSLTLVMEDLVQACLRLGRGQELAVEPLPARYIDFAARQHHRHSQQGFAPELDYWQERLAGAPGVHALPLDRPRDPGSANPGAVLVRRTDGQTLHRLRAFCQDSQATLFNFSHALYSLFLAKYSKETDIVLGTPVLDRSEAKYQKVVGLFIDNLILRCRPDMSLSFGDWLSRCRQQFMADLEHQRVPFELIARSLADEASQEYNPVFQLMLVVQNLQPGLPRLPGISLSEQTLKEPAAKLDLTLNVIDGGDFIDFRWEYNAALFEHGTITAMAEQMAALLEQCLATPQQAMSALTALTRAQSAQLARWNQTEAAFERQLCLHQTFELVAKKQPGNTAVRFGDKVLSYGELNARANRLARYLVSQGAGPDQRIGMMLERSLDMVVALLGILKAGAAYVPLDPAYPVGRLAYMVRDSKPLLVLSQQALRDILPRDNGCPVLALDALELASWGDSDGACTGVTSNNLAYMIYTSGSTGQPKGVMIEHLGVVNLFASLSRTRPVKPQQPEVWLASTSISFDISVLELFWSLSRGAEVVLQAERTTALPALGRDSKLGMSLFFFSSDAEAEEPYNLLFKGAEFADQHGFEAIWVPERHFHQFGGIFPNAAVAGAAVAALTQNVAIRAGSVVLPLHDPIRVAEEWAMIDKMSGGRVGLSVAPGWHPNDFVLAPQQYGQRRDVVNKSLAEINTLWQGGQVSRSNGTGARVPVSIFPKPVQAELPVWVTIAKNPEAFRYAGEQGFNILTHLLGQSFEELEARIALYRQARKDSGLDPDTGKITLMIHSFVSDDIAYVKQHAGTPFREYLRNSVDLLKPIARESGLDLDKADNMDTILDAAFSRYFNDYSLIGTPQSCLGTLQRLHALGVDEIACLVDFGIAGDIVLANLPYLNQLQQQFNCRAAQLNYLHRARGRSEDDLTLIGKHGINHVQMTPSYIKEMAATALGREALARVDCLLVGGEAVSADLSARLCEAVGGEVYNVYGPTETTIWSAIRQLRGDAYIGGPVANTQFYIMDKQLQLQGPGSPGELYIGGLGLARGYFNDQAKTDASFIRWQGQRIYRTGDLARWREDGTLEYLGRADFQAKIRGFRIELEEVEAKIRQLPRVGDAVARVQKDPRGQDTLVAYVVLPDENTGLDEAAFFTRLQTDLRDQLADFMVPDAFARLDRLPLTPNGKLDRKQLPPISPAGRREAYVAPRNHIERTLCEIWQSLFNLEQVSIRDNFYALGGHSLTATRLHARIRETLAVDLSLREMFMTQSLAELAQVVAAAGEGDESEIIPVERGEQMPLSYGQKRLWFIDQLDHASAQYNEFIALKLSGGLDLDAVAKSFSALLGRHEILRTSYHSDEQGLGYQVIGEHRDFSPVLLDVSGAGDPRLAVDELLEKEVRRPFDLSRDLMLRVTVVRVAQDEHVLLITLHHIASDGWSRTVLKRDFAAFYQHFTLGQALPEPLTVQFADYAAWQQSRQYQHKVREHLAYWRTQLDGLPQVHDLPLDSQRPALQTYDGARVNLSLTRAQSQGIKNLAREGKMTAFVVLQAVFATLLARFSQSRDIVMGTIVANREARVLEPMIGSFVNTLVLRSRFEQGMTFARLLKQSDEMIAQALAHQQVPFELLVDALQPQRTTAHQPLFQIALVYHSYERDQVSLPGVSLSSYPHEAVIAKFDLQLNVVEQAGQFELGWEYNTALFDPGTVTRLAQGFSQLLDSCLASPESGYEQLAIAGDGQALGFAAQQALTVADYPSEQTLHQMFEARAAASPDMPALEFGEQTLTYRELNARANQLAHALRAQQAVTADTLVALYLDRSLEMVVAILGVLKAGAAYVPIALDFPRERVAFLLEDTGAGTVISQEQYLSRLRDWSHGLARPPALLAADNPAATAEFSRSNPDVGSRPEDLAYVIYTSGTTGKPKGVMVPHAGVVNRIHWMQSQYPLTHEDRVLQKTPYTFDVSVWELLWANWVGAKIVMAPPGVHKEPQQLNRLITEKGISILHFVPSMLSGYCQYLQDAGERLPAAPRHIFCSGEALTAQHVRQYRRVSREHTGLHNLYGPTEASIDVSYFSHAQQREGNVPIGRAIDNTQLLVLDGQLQTVPPGAIGELYIGGAGLARGYLNREALTAERFIEHPQLNVRLYRTGDLVRWRADNELEYLGRNDFQVKIRGYRIELGEIENLLGRLAGVKQAVVIDREEQGSTYLAAYLVFEEGREPAQADLRDHLAGSLPDYMVPTTFTALDSLPLSVNGKLDRRALPAPQRQSEGAYRAPKTGLQRQLCGIWQDLLGLEQVGIEDNFFRIGGDSIISIQLVSRLRRAGLTVQVRDIFDAPTIAGLCRLLEQAQADGIAAEQGQLSGEFALLPVQRDFFAHAWQNPHYWNQAFMMRIPAGIETRVISRALTALAQQHDMLRCRFRRDVQYYDSQSTMADLVALDVSGLDESRLQAQLSQWQSGFDLDGGKLWQVAHLHAYPDGNDRLFFAFHHLIMDAVSWRILVEDMQTLLQGQTLPAKTSSYRQWVAAVSEYGQTRRQQLDYWHQVQVQQTALPGAEALTRTSFTLSEAHTRMLLREANQGYHTDINELLLSALSLALEETLGRKRNHLTLEGHGRETIEPGLDLSRTLGWFASLYPVCLQAGDGIAETIINTKEMLRAVPDKGIGYGALKDAGLLDAPPLPAIRFNYFGQLNDAGMWQVSGEKTGKSRDGENDNGLLLDINGAVRDNVLGFVLESRLARQQTGVFARAFESALVAVTEEASRAARDGGVNTPSDYPYVQLSPERLRALEQKYQFSDLYPASSLQQGFIHHHIQEPQDEAYRVQVLLDYRLALDVPAFKQAWQLASLRYPSLRVAFDWQGEPIQVITREASITEQQFCYLDLSGLNREQREQEITRIQARERARTFDLTRPGLLRLTLIKQDDQVFTVLKTSHHSISDGWSEGFLWQTVHGYYQALVRGQTPVVEADASYLLAQQYNARMQAQTQAYWLKAKQGFSEANDLSPMLNQGARLAGAGAPQHLEEQLQILRGDDYLRLKAMCGQQGITVNVALQFAWHKLLQAYTQDEQTIVGTTVSGRSMPVDNIESGVGLYINTLPLVVNWPEDASVAEVLQSVHLGVTDLNTYAAMPLAKLQSHGRRLFHSLLVFENYPFTPGGQAGADDFASKIRLRASAEKTDYPLTLLAFERGPSLELKLAYDQALLTGSQAKRLLAQLALVLGQISENVRQSHQALTLLAGDERDKVLYRWNRTDCDYPQHNTLQQQFERQVARTPDNIALEYGEQQLSYRQLNERANQLAHLIRQSVTGDAGTSLAPDTLIALYLDRSLEMVISILAVLKAGGAYVPLSPEYPQQRSAFIVEDTAAPLLLTQQQHLTALEDWCGSVAILAVDQDEVLQAFSGENPLAASGPEDLAYVIYTSGTTGRPKGVMVPHSGVVNRLHWMQMQYPLDAADKVLQKTPYTFDVSVWELLWANWVGARIVMAPPHVHTDPQALAALMAEKEVTTLHFVPSMLSGFCRYLADSGMALPAHISRVFCSGEALSTGQVREFDRVNGGGSGLYNLYGPTEASIDVSYFDCGQINTDLVPIGRAINNTRLLVLDKYLQPVPVGVPGELYIGGAGLARGYLNRAELTGQSFIENPFATANDKVRGYHRLYKTGDMVRWLAGGELDYLGRNDFQVKIRGHRIEPEEIRAALCRHEAVANAQVIARNNNLVAYVIADKQWLEAQRQRGAAFDDSRGQGRRALSRRLRQSLSLSLPGFMVPQQYVVVDVFPLTANGKLDRKALPDPAADPGVTCAGEQYVAPENETQVILSRIWQQLLGADRVGIEDNFFELGGDSILAIQVALRATEQQLPLTTRDIMAQPTIAALSAYLAGQGAEEERELLEI
ncbi:non-ribosomal peptide synthetase [Thalassomonas viridans]|uniref:Non-ribosomal peptide synthetase n=1 Tax=Thalassomonas viridans TaxID=137584 RepID=A0AAF0CE65_9GAMM|nr:non-ribosomal peptide synthetase [Thalassomonas viridans]WDE09241.1 non-ribosomal peptide synthetase [Thalassomonas viridans]